ncbi:isochorismatase family cysteine hydrolase [candidate division CSSED10-310 bacterium]|uniref:Isochorismatase family cysteine hydrolase n=1 Tax=candidate division CSSED10-310 bacterium TaxID=2855610 RepID=A0ABV6YX66_UNCC1
MKKPALIIIDMQQHFFRENPLPFREKLLPNIQTVLTAARSAKIPIIHIITRYNRQKTDWPKAWHHLNQIWCLEGTVGVHILEEVKPLPDEIVVVKKRFSGFYDTDLNKILRQNAIDSLLITGYASDVCVRMTVMDAYNRGYDLYLLADCVHAARETTEQSLQYLTWLTNLKLISSSEMNTLLDD